MNQSHHVSRLDIVDVEQIRFGVRIGNLVWHATRHHGCAHRVESEIPSTKLNDQRLLVRVGERNQAGLLVRVFDCADIGKARAILCRALWRHYKVADFRRACLELNVIDPAKHLWRQLAACE